MEITKNIFRTKMGYDPEDDDLDRCNCKEAGNLGHECCGWCKIHDKPMYACSCRFEDHDRLQVLQEDHHVNRK